MIPDFHDEMLANLEAAEGNLTKAIELLQEAGWTERDSDGTLTKDGKRLSITIMYRSQGFEKYLTSYQEACRKVGVEVKLNLVTPETAWKSMMERTYQVGQPAARSGRLTGKRRKASQVSI